MQTESMQPRLKDKSVTKSSRDFGDVATVHARTRCQRPLRPLLMAETAVWALCASTSHVISTATSTLDDDLMLTVDDADDLQVCADPLLGPTCSYASLGCLMAALSEWY